MNTHLTFHFTLDRTPYDATFSVSGIPRPGDRVTLADPRDRDADPLELMVALRPARWEFGTHGNGEPMTPTVDVELEPVPVSGGTIELDRKDI